MLFDKARIRVEGGAGGDGCVGFRREAHVPKGGPDGGDGGRGGSVTVVCDPSKRDLAALKRRSQYHAKPGGHGKGSQKHGARGEDVTIAVPPGTQVTAEDGTRFDLLEPGQMATLARGGAGGRGNRQFATATRQAPRFAEKGLPGESGWVELRLKLLADAGLVGMPNAGKSSLLARLTRAAPKVADYPFTTLEPVLGTLESDQRQLVLADIPGLIEGAAEGAGLGHEFLAHVERCRMLVHVIELAPSAGDPIANHEAVRGELERYGAGLERLPEMAVLSKADLLPAEEVDATVAEWKARLGDAAIDVLATSCATGAGIGELARAILFAYEATEPEIAVVELEAGGFEAEHRIYTPGAEHGFNVVRVGDGVFRVEGAGIERLIGRHDLGSEEALAHVEARLHAIGVVGALRGAGFEPGDELQIGDAAFDFWPDR